MSEELKYYGDITKQIGLEGCNAQIDATLVTNSGLPHRQVIATCGDRSITVVSREGGGREIPTQDDLVARQCAAMCLGCAFNNTQIGPEQKPSRRGQ